MRSRFDRKLVLLGLLISCFAIAQETPAPVLPEVKPGETWTYIFSDLPNRRVVFQTTQEVLTVDASNIIVNSVRGDGRPFEVKYGRDWLQPGDFRVYDFPLEVGKKWSYTRTYNSPQCGPSTDELVAEVKGWEDVEVPAGKFRALKIEHNGRYIGGPCGTGPKEHWYWYVPAVKRHIKYEQHVYNRLGGDMVVGELVVLKTYTVK